MTAEFSFRFYVKSPEVRLLIGKPVKLNYFSKLYYSEDQSRSICIARPTPTQLNSTSGIQSWSVEIGQRVG